LRVEQRAGERDGPAFEREGVAGHALDDGLNELEAFDVWQKLAGMVDGASCSIDTARAMRGLSSGCGRGALGCVYLIRASGRRVG
jgi:hypothetical protein